jgi:hypothetical protein
MLIVTREIGRDGEPLQIIGGESRSGVRRQQPFIHLIPVTRLNHLGFLPIR